MQQETTEGIHTRQRLRAVPKKQGETLVLGTEMRSVCLEISNTSYKQGSRCCKAFQEFVLNLSVRGSKSGEEMDLFTCVFCEQLRTGQKWRQDTSWNISNPSKKMLSRSKTR